MKIKFYGSFLCPRCFMACRFLKELSKDSKGITIEEIDVLQHPKKTWHAGIRMIPALQVGDKILSGSYLTKKRIQNFLKNLE